MTTSRSLAVEPIYGWGWVHGGQDSPVPAPFSVTIHAVRSADWLGTIGTAGHAFGGQAIALSQRHAEWDGVVNVVIGPDLPPDRQVCGYAKLSEHPDAIAG